MKILLFGLLTIAYQHTNAQDSLKLEAIDSMVAVIEHSGLPIIQDTIVQDYPSLKLHIVSAPSMIVSNGKVVKYTNYAITSREENGVPQKTDATSCFYYHDDKLIKVEETVQTGDKTMAMAWYYENEQPLYYTLQSPKSADRAVELLNISKAMMEKANSLLSKP